MSHDHEPRTDVVGLSAPGGRAILRAGDDDRKRVVDWLQTHYVAGRLTQMELEERVERALAARTFGELDALTTDLPELQAPSATPSSEVPADDRRQRRREIREERRRRRQAGARKGFGAHAASYVLVMAMLVVIWLLTSPGGYFWPVWPMLGWGIGLASHGLAILFGGTDGSHGPRAHFAI
jgi:hypothetical protein